VAAFESAVAVLFGQDKEMLSNMATLILEVSEAGENYIRGRLHREVEDPVKHGPIPVPS
jgi:hypothetical protein